MGQNLGAIGFAMYFDEFERLPLPSREYDVDIWLEATQAEAAGILAAVRKLTEQGESVRVADSLPLGLRARRHLRYTDKEGLQEC